MEKEIEDLEIRDDKELEIRNKVTKGIRRYCKRQ
ncbi:hypothetical protein FHU26_004908 [Clostridium beijerinckii]|nr:hypothetical protein [Clostridium beijerinckii]